MMRLFPVLLAGAHAAEVHLDTPFGPLVGSSDGDVEKYVGIEYASAERFGRAVLREPWGPAPLEALEYGPSCIQSSGGAGTPAIDPAMRPGGLAKPPDERCLFLNAYRPARKPKAPRPIMVWVHGGGFCTGSGASAWFEGSNLAKRADAVVVTLNYRLGPLGFAADGKRGGANGLWDVIRALEFVNALREALGGGPITLFGESSGGVAVCALSASPAAKGLFRRSVVQSGPCVVDAPDGWGPGSVASGVATTKRFTEYFNASDLDGMRGVDASELQWKAEDSMDPTFSGWLLDESLIPGGRPPSSYYLADPPTTHVDEMILGVTSKDGTAAFYGSAPLANVTGDDAYVAHLATAWGSRALARKIADNYALYRFGGDVSAAFVQADADHYLVCPTLDMARSLNQRPRGSWWAAWAAWWAGAAPPAPRSPTAAWTYVFSHWSDAGCDASLTLLVEAYRPWDSPYDHPLPFASHGSDIAYTFGNDFGPNGLAGVQPTPRDDCPKAKEERALADAIADYWGSFARDGAPRRQRDTDKWRRNAVRKLAVRSDGGLANIDGFKRADCRFWASVKDDVDVARRRGRA